MRPAALLLLLAGCSAGCSGALLTIGETAAETEDAGPSDKSSSSAAQPTALEASAEPGDANPPTPVETSEAGSPGAAAGDAGGGPEADGSDAGGPLVCAGTVDAGLSFEFDGGTVNAHCITGNAAASANGADRLLPPFDFFYVSGTGLVGCDQLETASACTTSCGAYTCECVLANLSTMLCGTLAKCQMVNGAAVVTCP